MTESNKVYQQRGRENLKARGGKTCAVRLEKASVEALRLVQEANGCCPESRAVAIALANEADRLERLGWGRKPG